MFNSYSRHKIYATTGLPFSADEYSKFKFGDGDIARQFGCSLAESFILEFGDLLLANEDIVVVPSPYNTIPTASYWMAEGFIKELNLFLSNHSKRSILRSKIYRFKTYSDDYGSMTYEQRVNLISTDTYYIDKEFLANRLVLFIDDIKITGSHEFVIQNMIEEKKIDGQFFFLYFAELKNGEISPTFENVLNYSFVKGLEEVIQIVEKESFLFNTRVIKFILKKPVLELELIIKSISYKKISKVVELAISNNYHLMPEYRDSLNFLIKLSNYGN